MIPVNEPLLGKKELEYVRDCVSSGWISSKGSYIGRFEEGFSSYCGVRYGVTTTNGTNALHLALASLGIGKGDEVIMPTFTMIATAYAVLYTGAKPVFVDSEPRAYNMDVSQVEGFLNSKTKVLLPVHIYGHPVDMDPLLAIAKKHKLYVLEDAAEAHGAEYKGRKCGSIGDLGCFSFYANKIITTGEGGMVITDNKKLAERLRLLKDLAHSPKKRFLHFEVAYNYRMTNMQAAVGLAQLERIESFIRKKQKMARLYRRYLKDIEGYINLARPVNFYTVLEAASRKNDLAIGYKIIAEENISSKNFGVYMDPDKSLVINFSAGDSVIVLSEKK